MFGGAFNGFRGKHMVHDAKLILPFNLKLPIFVEMNIIAHDHAAGAGEKLVEVHVSKARLIVKRSRFKISENFGSLFFVLFHVGTSLCNQHYLSLHKLIIYILCKAVITLSPSKPSFKDDDVLIFQARMSARTIDYLIGGLKMEGKYENMAIEVLRPYTRDAPYPLDATTLFTSYASAMRYAKTDKSAYPGQVISVDDSLLSKTAIYQVSYDKNGDGYTLEDITVGSGSQAFSFIGSVDTKSSLPATYVLNGDMYYVKDENAMYVAIKDKDSSSLSWQKLGMDITIPYATKTNDGIITKEQYSTFFNSNEEDSVYFNSPSDNSGAKPKPETNKWIRVEHAEKTENYSIASVGKVKDLLKTVVTQATPHIDVSIEGGQYEFYSGNVVDIKLAIRYYKELGGSAAKIKITRGDYVVYDNGSPDFDNYLNNTISVSDKIDDTAKDNSFIEYLVEVDYEASDEGTIPAGICYGKIDIYFFDKIKYGTNLQDNEAFLKSGSSYTILISPADIASDATYDEWKANAIDSVYVTLPKIGFAIDYILYVPQMDYSAISLFSNITENSDGTVTYKYVLPHSGDELTKQRFLSRATFIVKIK